MRAPYVFQAALAASVLLGAPDASAQARKVFGMLSIGPAVPVGTFSDGFDAGWSFAAGVGTTLANKAVEVRGTLSYGSFGASEGVDGTSTPLSVTGDVLYHLGAAGGRARPYLLGGVGFSSVGYKSSYSYEGPGGGGGYSERENGVTFGAGGGLMVQGAKAGLFVEGRYAAISGSGHSHIPVTVGVRLGGR